MDIIRHICSVKIPNNLPSTVYIISIIDNEDDDKYYTLTRNTKNILRAIDELPSPSPLYSDSENKLTINIKKTGELIDIYIYWLNNDFTEFELVDFSSWIDDICKKLNYNIIVDKKRNRCILHLSR